MSCIIGNIALGIYSITNPLYITKYEYIFIPLCISLCLSGISIWILLFLFCKNIITLFMQIVSYFILLSNIFINIYIVGLYNYNSFFMHNLSFIYVCISLGLNIIFIFNIICFTPNKTSDYPNKTAKYPQAIDDYIPLNGAKIKTARNVTI